MFVAIFAGREQMQKKKKLIEILTILPQAPYNKSSLKKNT